MAATYWEKIDYELANDPERLKEKIWQKVLALNPESIAHN